MTWHRSMLSPPPGGSNHDCVTYSATKLGVLGHDGHWRASLPPSAASRGVITSPVAGVINSGGPGFGSLDEHLRPSGPVRRLHERRHRLRHLPRDQSHSSPLSLRRAEWFSNQGTRRPPASPTTWARWWRSAASRCGTRSRAVSAGWTSSARPMAIDFLTARVRRSMSPTSTSARELPGGGLLVRHARDARFIRFDMSGARSRSAALDVDDSSRARSGRSRSTSSRA